MKEIQELDFTGGKTETWESLKEPKSFDNNTIILHDNNIYIFGSYQFNLRPIKYNPVQKLKRWGFEYLD